MIRVALLVFGLWMLFLSGMVTFIRRDEVEPHYLEFTSLDSYSLISTCRLFYFHHPLECDFLDWEGRTIPSPDGRHRLVARDDGEPTVYTLYSSRKPLEFANHGAEPSWSPDGRWLVYSDYTECCDTSLYRLELATGDVEQLTDMEGSEFYPTWSPDGERIAFVWGGAFRTSYLYIMGADGSNPYEVLPGLTSVIRPQWSPDGERILFYSSCPEYALFTLGERECIRADYDVYSLRLADGHLQRMAVTRLPIDEYNPVWSPDGEWVVYATSEQILMARPDGSDVQEVTGQRQIRLDFPTWVKTPDLAWRPIIFGIIGLVCVMIGARKRS